MGEGGIAWRGWGKVRGGGEKEGKTEEGAGEEEGRERGPGGWRDRASHSGIARRPVQVYSRCPSPSK